jgi:hypothetical protein
MKIAYHRMMIKALRCPSSPMSRIELGQRISSI